MGGWGVRPRSAAEGGKGGRIRGRGMRKNKEIGAWFARAKTAGGCPVLNKHPGTTRGCTGS